MPTDLQYTYCTEADIQALLGADGTTARVDDDGTASQSAAEAEYLSQAIQWATDRCNFYLLGRYPAARLATSWLVNQWCVICAAKWLSSRRGNPPPGVVNDLYEQAVEDMKLVHDGKYDVPNIATRTAQWPFWSNVRVDALYSLRKIRVERPISEKSNTTYPQNADRVADVIVEF